MYNDGIRNVELRNGSYWRIYKPTRVVVGNIGIETEGIRNVSIYDQRFRFDNITQDVKCPVLTELFHQKFEGISREMSKRSKCHLFIPLNI